MNASNRTSKVLALLIPAGVLGISAALATTQAINEPVHASPRADAPSVAERLTNIRKAFSEVKPTIKSEAAPDVKLMLAEWLNFGGGLGWRNGGWHNWGNGGWGNGGWHNWGNGGWHNWGNGWHNFWHNW
jgi:rSAM-associated Gly-rich repeat protein